jgi:glycosyltransferase involved in cell wall biosynthesis
MKILMVEPFCTGSHQAWLEGYQQYSQHEVQVLSLSGRHWKWRMHGGAVSLARKYQEMGFQPDVIVATDMLDLTTFLALCRKELSSIPVVLYMHENQLTYPWSPEDEDVPRNRDRHYGFINYTSALTADEVWFNSAHHQAVFLDALPDFLRAFPDYREPTTVREIERKSRVMSIGLDLSFESLETQNLNPKPTILWNHRWEYDKGPEPFFEALFAFQEEGLAFELIVLGESYGRKPEIFAQAEERLADRILQWGFADSRYEYWQWLQRADILPVSSWHDFFGISVVEAISRNCYPLLPNRLAYPEHVPAECLYEEGEFTDRLRELIQRIDWVRSRNTTGWVQRYDWSEVAPQYDTSLQQLFNQNREAAQPKNWTEIH